MATPQIIPALSVVGRKRTIGPSPVPERDRGRVFHSLEADRFWAQECLGFHIQARPDPETAKKLMALQLCLSAVSPVSLLPIPADALHLSVFTLVSAQPSVRSKEELWTTIRSAMTEDMVALVDAKELVPITFRRLAFTPQALIVASEDQPEPFRTLRSKVGALLQSLGLFAPEYDQTHVTIARFAESMDVDPELLASIERTFVTFTGVFENIRFVRERQYPSLVIDDL